MSCCVKSPAQHCTWSYAAARCAASQAACKSRAPSFKLQAARDNHIIAGTGLASSDRFAGIGNQAQTGLASPRPQHQILRDPGCLDPFKAEEMRALACKPPAIGLQSSSLPWALLSASEALGTKALPRPNVAPDMTQDWIEPTLAGMLLRPAPFHLA